LWLFDLRGIQEFMTGASQEAPAPQLLARMASPYGGDAISNVRWTHDSENLTFLGRRDSPERRLVVMNLNDLRLKELSLPGQDVTSFDRNENGVVYTAAAMVSESELYQSAGPALPDIQAGTGSSLEMLLYPEEAKKSLNLQAGQLWQLRDGNTQPVMNLATGASVSIMNSRLLSLSPDGSQVMITAYARRVPKEWEAYQSAIANLHFVADPSNASPVITTYRPQQYVRVDLQTGEEYPAVDAPIGWGAGYFGGAHNVVWLPDAGQIVLSNTFVPLTGLTPDSSHSGPLHPCVLAVDLRTRESQCLSEMATTGPLHHSQRFAFIDVQWSPADHVLLIRHRRGALEDDKSAEAYRRDADGWKKLPAALGTAGVDSRLSFTVQQSVNQPPMLVARDRSTGRSKEIWNPNPQLAGFSMGEANVYHWRDPAGRLWTGGLVKPPYYVPGRRYPLVIQTHGFDQDEFLVDGFSTTANAARAMAARGIVVLQVQEIRIAHLTPKEADIEGRDGYQAAIEQLSKQGVIDPKKVGIIGWSRTGWYVLESLMTRPNLFAAATLAESTHGDLTQYWFLVDYALGPVLANSIADAIGKRPTQAGLTTWLVKSPEFNAARIRTPILFEQNSPSALIYGWDLYAALRSLGSPVDLLYIRNGEHVLVKPLERLASGEMNVDWYDFWLNQHEDPDPAKAAQYERWRKLRRLHAPQYQTGVSAH
jgi:hypothetical protein